MVFRDTVEYPERYAVLHLLILKCDVLRSSSEGSAQLNRKFAEPKLFSELNNLPTQYFLRSGLICFELID